MESKSSSLVIESVFGPGEWIPSRHCAWGENLSPPVSLRGLDPGAKSIAIILDDITHPIFGVFNHWLIWNIPACEQIPAGIPAGRSVPELKGAKQGVAYGVHRYRGPKPPLRRTHAYRMTLYVLDCLLDLKDDAQKKQLTAAMQGHILQRGVLTGIARRNKAPRFK